MIDIDERYVEKKSFFNRLLVVYIFFGIAFSFFLHKTYSLQISEYTNYESASIKNKTKEVLVQPVRGVIYDRNGNIIVKNVPTYDLILKPSKVISIENFLNNISDGIVITGGSANMEGMVKLGEKLSNLKFKIGIPKYNLPRKSDNLMKPENSVILGMTKFYALEQDKEFTFNQSKGIIARVLEWIRTEL